MQEYWNTIIKELIELNRYYHSKELKMGDKERLQNFKYIYNETILKIKEKLYNNEEFKEYIKKRNKVNIKLNKLQNNIIYDIKKTLEINKIYPLSSFTARMNLITDSDLDFVIIVNNLSECLNDITNKLINNNFILKEKRFVGVDKRREYYVFSKKIEFEKLKVEIELKLREENYFEKIIYPIHKYLEEEINEEDKEIITWIKYNLKESKEGYIAFKTIMHENALANLNINELLMPLE